MAEEHVLEQCRIARLTCQEPVLLYPLVKGIVCVNTSLKQCLLCYCGCCGDEDDCIGTDDDYGAGIDGDGIDFDNDSVDVDNYGMGMNELCCL